MKLAAAFRILASFQSPRATGWVADKALVSIREEVKVKKHKWGASEGICPKLNTKLEKRILSARGSLSVSVLALCGEKHMKRSYS